MKNACTNLHIVTDDGSNGRKHWLPRCSRSSIDAGNQYDAVIAIGPMIMMKFVTQRPHLARTASKPSFPRTTIMVDGTGMCGGCRLTVGGETKFACVDPVLTVTSLILTVQCAAVPCTRHRARR